MREFNNDFLFKIIDLVIKSFENDIKTFTEIIDKYKFQKN